MSEVVQQFFAGSIGFLVGLVIVIFRVQVAHFYAEQLSNLFGRASKSAVRRSTPGRTAFSGVVLMCIGAVLVVVSLVRPTQ